MTWDHMVCCLKGSKGHQILKGERKIMGVKWATVRCNIFDWISKSDRDMCNLVN
jgi:hypothetical protein